MTGRKERASNCPNQEEPTYPDGASSGNLTNLLSPRIRSKLRCKSSTCILDSWTSTRSEGGSRAPLVVGLTLRESDGPWQPLCPGRCAVVYVPLPLISTVFVYGCPREPSPRRLDASRTAAIYQDWLRLPQVSKAHHQRREALVQQPTDGVAEARKSRGTCVIHSFLT